MKLQSKIFLILASLWVLICLGIYLDSKLTLERDYKKLEKNLAEKDILRVQKALQNKLSALRLYTNSWSQWDGAYQFMKDKNKEFVASNFVPGTFTSSNLNFFIFYDANGKFFDGRAFDLNKKTFVTIPETLITTLNSKQNFVKHTAINQGNVGILNISEGTVVMSSLPVLTSDGLGPIRGTLLMGYYITPEFFHNLSETVGFKIDYIPLSLINHFPYAKTANAKLLNQPYYFIPKNQDIAYGFMLLKDIDNNSIGIMRAELPRSLYNEGLLTIYHYLFISVILGVIILAAMIYLLKSLVLNRILSVSKQVIDINNQGKFQQRIKISGHDELNSMVASINSMLELIELTQEQLKYRISRRTKDMERLAHLNRNLFKEMSKQRSIETKLREDERWLRKMAYYDTLTDLPNRAFFNELLQKSISQAEHDNSKIAILFLDFDKFKKMNDTYGHDFGDKLLKTIADRLRASLKETDVAARLAGDEFLLFITNIKNKDMIDDAVANIFHQLSQPIHIENVFLKPTFSIGISVYPEDGTTLEQVINAADLAMYYAKKQEGNSFRYYGAIENLRSSSTPLS